MKNYFQQRPWLEVRCHEPVTLANTAIYKPDNMATEQV